MTLRSTLARLFEQEDINFLLTNRVPRRLLTQFMGWFSKIEQPWVRDASIAIWKLFSDLDLKEAKKAEFASLHDCFIRELREGARPVDPDPAIVISPCDAIVGACGRIQGTELLQIKGFPYKLQDLLGDGESVKRHHNGLYVTLRLTTSMYHRFHAPHDARIEGVTYISGDTWNVNPIALRRIEELFCKNERAVIQLRLAVGHHPITLVAVAAILVASIRLHGADVLRLLARRGVNPIPCQAEFRKGDEMGWFEHGSTIIVLAPENLSLDPNIEPGRSIRMGQPLMRLPAAAAE